jgi:hypothetical protein
MRLSRKPPPARALARRVPRPWDPPETEFPALVPVGVLPFGRSEQTAIAITGIWAYSNGFEFLVTRLIRPDAPGFDEDPVPGTPKAGLAERQSFQIALQLADGRRVVSGRSGGDTEPAGPILRPSGGGGSSHRVVLRWWAWPLPPQGRLAFRCQLGTGETQASMDAQLILDAARQSEPVWPAPG